LSYTRVAPKLTRGSGRRIIKLLARNETRPSTPLGSPPPMTVGTDDFALRDLDHDVRPRAMRDGSCDLERLLGEMVELEDHHVVFAAIDARV